MPQDHAKLTSRGYTRIDELQEDLLDILAYDFKIDWWDSDYTLPQKRQMFRDNWPVHRILGTKAAVLTAISAIYPGTTLMEWFEYGGEPFHFKLKVDLTKGSYDPVKHQRVLDRVAFYKNLRSHLDSVDYISKIYAKAENSFSAIFDNFRVHVALLEPTVIRGVKLDGSKRLDGSWNLRAYTVGPKLEKLSLRLSIYEPTVARGMLLDGSNLLNGTHPLLAVEYGTHFKRLAFSGLAVDTGSIMSAAHRTLACGFSTSNETSATLDRTYFPVLDENGENRTIEKMFLMKDVKDITMTEATPALWGAVQWLVKKVEELEGKPNEHNA